MGKARRHLLDTLSVRAAVAAKAANWTVAASPYPEFAFAPVKPKPRAFKPKGRRLPRTAVALNAAPPQPSVDWRHGHTLTPPLDQGAHNTCTAFAVTGIMGDLHEIGQPGTRLQLSAGHLHACIAGLAPDTPLDPTVALAALRQARVAALSAGDYPFNPANCAAAQGALGVQGSEPILNPDDAKDALGSGPILVVMSLYDDFWRFYQGGVYKHATGAYLGSHSIAVVGYDDPAGCWIVRNSRGSAWGENGFGRIAYGECDIFGMNGGYRVVL